MNRQTNNYNLKLTDLYSIKLDELDFHLRKYNLSAPVDKKATNPFLVSVPEDYTNFENSIMIFGQETNGWCKECGNDSEYSKSLHKSIEIYNTFYFGGRIKKYRGPFWNEFKRIKREVSRSKSSVFIWNNINKIGRIGKGNITDINKIQFEHFQVIREEIRLLNPSILIFLTGPDYDFFIKNNIGEFNQSVIGDCLLEVTFLNEFKNIKAFKTFHPNALYHQGKNRVVIQNLIEKIKQACI